MPRITAVTATVATILLLIRQSKAEFGNRLQERPNTPTVAGTRAIQSLKIIATMRMLHESSIRTLLRNNATCISTQWSDRSGTSKTNKNNSKIQRTNRWSWATVDTSTTIWTAKSKCFGGKCACKRMYEREWVNKKSDIIGPTISTDIYYPALTSHEWSILLRWFS